MYEPSNTSCLTHKGNNPQPPIAAEIDNFANEVIEKMFINFSNSDVLLIVQLIREKSNRSIINQAITLETEANDKAQTAENYRKIADQI